MSHILDERSVSDPDGREVPLSGLWADQLAVVVFVRHFGCIFCRQQVAELATLQERVTALGGHIHVVGNGTLEEARAFRDERRLPFPVYTDPTRQVYDLVGMRRGLRTVLVPGVLLRSLKARRAGFRQTGVAGDPLQQGGVLVVAPGGRELYRFISREAGDHAPVADILSAIERAATHTPPASSHR